jgi:CBS domain-containing protein
MGEISYQRVLDKLDNVKDNGHQARALCPAHDDRNPSLSVTRTEGRTLIYCHAGCSQEQVVEAIDFTMADLFDEQREDGRWGTVVARYEYPGGRVVFRTANKDFPQPNTAKNKDTTLFHEDRITAADVVYVVEGEEDVHAIEAAGGSAVCSAMGAGKANKFNWQPLEGKQAIIVADRDKAGRKHAAQVADLIEKTASSVRIVEPAVGKDASDHVAAGKSLTDFLDTNQAASVSLISLSEVQPERVEWLWPGYLPKGKLVTLDGDPGLGKSTITDYIAGVVTTGGLWPDGTCCDHPGAVLLLSAEDGLADTVRPRLDAAGADVTKVHAIEGVPVVDEDGNTGLRSLTLGDIKSLRSAIEATGAVVLIVDVLMAYLPSGSDAHKDQDVRAILGRLTKLADDTGCTVILIRHLNKSTGRDPLYRGGGSIGIVGAGRCALLVAADPDDEGRRVLAVMKTNLGQTPDAMAYRLVSFGDYGVARVEWEGRVDYNAHTLLGDRPDAQEATAANEAKDWLEDYLSQNGSVRSSDAKRDAAKIKISERTLQRASEKLKVVSRSEGFPRVTWWSLPSDANNEKSDPDTQNPGATGATGDDQQKHVGATGPKIQSRQGLYDGATVIPGAVTDRTPGMTPAVERALKAAHAGGRFHADPPCFHCGKGVTGKHQDDQGRYVHFQCEKAALAAVSGN